MSYRFLELVCSDVDEMRRRLAARDPKRSQMRGLYEAPPDADAPSSAKRVGRHRWETVKPAGSFLVLDTSEPFDDYLRLALHYLDS